MAANKPKLTGEQLRLLELLGSSPKDMNLANATPEGLIDELGQVRAWKSKLQTWEKFFGEATKARMNKAGDTTVTGDALFDGLLENIEQIRISSEKVRELADENFLAKVTNVVTFQTLRTTRKNSVA